MDRQVELLHRRLERERLARKQAEMIIEEKSRELYVKSQELERMAAAEHQARTEAELLRQALEAFTSRLDLDGIVAYLMDFLKSLIPYDSSAIYFVEGEDLRLHSLKGDSKEGKVVGEVITPPACLSHIRQASHPIIISDMNSDVRAREWGIHLENGTWMGVPMSAHGRNIGCLTLVTSQRGPFSESTVSLIHAIANEAAIAFENARLFQEVERLSTVDPLTGLHNRRYFFASAQTEFQRSLRYHLPLTAIIMDIDHFKRVNDSYGHAVGDRVLVEMAAVCRREIRLLDLAARYGGEEFCFLLPETDWRGAYNFAERLRAAIVGLHFEADGRNFNVTASFGVAERLADKDSIDNLLERSDQALYEAKRGGRNRVMVWKPS